VSPSDLISNPLFIAVAAGLVAIILSVGLSSRYAERTALNYSIRQGRKRDHQLALLDGPADELIRQIDDTRHCFQVKIDYFSQPVALWASTLPTVEKGQKREGTGTDLLITHLETGYPETFTKLITFTDEWNKHALGVLDTAKNMVKCMNDANLLPASHHDGSSPAEWCDYPQVGADFVTVCLERWEAGRVDLTDPWIEQVKDELGDGWVVIWKTVLARTSTSAKAEEVVKALELFSRSELNNRLVDIFKEKDSLASLGKPVADALDVLRIKVNAGVPLKGSCLAGQKAVPKIE
jgi:hypothetical protein